MPLGLRCVLHSTSVLMCSLCRSIRISVRAPSSHERQSIRLAAWGWLGCAGCGADVERSRSWQSNNRVHCVSIFHCIVFTHCHAEQPILHTARGPPSHFVVYFTKYRNQTIFCPISKPTSQTLARFSDVSRK